MSRRRLRIALWLIAAVILVLAVGYCTVMWPTWKAEREFEAAVAELDAVDPDWRWDRIVAGIPRVPDDENAMVVLNDVRDRKLMPAQWLEFLTVDQWPPPGEERLHEPDGPGMPTGPMRPAMDRPPFVMDLIEKHPPGMRLSPFVARQLARTIKRHQELAEAIDPLAERPKAFVELPAAPRIEFVDIDSHDLSFDLRRLPPLIAAHRANGGDITGAIRQVRVMLGLGRTSLIVPTAIPSLRRRTCVRDAILTLERSLAGGIADEPTLRRLQSDFEMEMQELRIDRVLRGERAVAIWFLDQTIANPEFHLLIDRGFNRNSDDELFDSRAGRTAARRAKSESLRELTTILKLVAEPMPRWESGLTAVNERLRDGNPYTILSVDWAFRAIRGAQQCKAILSAAVGAIAIERFRLKNNRWPTTWEEVSGAGFLQKALEDPYTGSPLLIGRSKDGPLIYSVGRDQKDDGGRRAELPLFEPHDELFQLYEPNLRGRPYQPEPRERGE